MKKSYKTMFKTLIGVLVLSMAPVGYYAQLSGNYTIDKNTAASATNYTDITTFFAALSSQGVSGAVTADIVPNSGPYNEQISVGAIAGASASNSISIMGYSNTISFVNNSTFNQPWIVNLNGADYITFSDLTISGTGAYAYCVMITNGSDFNNFINCKLQVPANTTSTNQMPVVFSGSNANYFTGSNSGSDNNFINCEMISGYCGVWMYGMTGSPWNGNNKFQNCSIRDWYLYGMYAYFQRQWTITGCTIERPTRTTLTTSYGIFMTSGNRNALIEKNRIQKFYHGSPGFASTWYGIYAITNGSVGVATQHTVRNNIVSDMLNNSGTIYGMFFNNSSVNCYHNTIVLNNLSFNTTSQNYGLYITGSTSYPSNYYNNLVFMTQGGSGTKYPLFVNTTSGIVGNYNNYFVNNPQAGTNTYFWRAGFIYATLAAMQAAGGEPNSTSHDPLFISPSAGNYMPSSYPMNDLGTPLGVTDDISGFVRSTTVPDIGAIEFLNVPCSSAPSANSVLGPTAQVCPGTNVGLAFATAYTLSGLQYQWQSSTTSSVGPYTSISGGTNQAFNALNVQQNTWYSAIITCTNGNQTSNATGALVMIAPTTTNTVPYYESFEGITGTNKLPNCSWAVSSNANCLTNNSAQTNNRIARTGNKSASFFYNPGGTYYYYTNGIWLNAGVTYSASLWFTTEYYGYNNFTDLSIMYGATQSTTNLTTIATTGGAAISPTYKSLSNTFTVASSGLYYVAIKTDVTTSAFAQYLTWDDLFIEVPCSLNSNSITINTSTTSICAGLPVVLNASGASTYSWNTGNTGSSLTVTPSGNTSYMVTGTSSLSGCTATAVQNIIVNPSPLVTIINPNGYSVCKGSAITLQAFGASNYNWSNGGSTQMISVSPQASTNYSVIGINSFGCTNTATVAVTVNNLPNVVAAANNNQMCIGENLTLTATGATSYTWNSPSILIVGQQVVVSPSVSTTFTVIGSDANGCSGNTTYAIAVLGCVGIKEATTVSGVRVLPNPNNGEFAVIFNNGSEKKIEVLDITGRIVASADSDNKETVNFNISHLASGLYTVKILNGNSTEVVKIVKQ